MQKLPAPPELVNNNDKFPHLQSAPATKKQRQTNSDTEHENDSNAEQQAATSAKTKTASQFLDKMNAIRAVTLKETQQFEKRLEAIETQQQEYSEQVLQNFQESQNTAKLALAHAVKAKAASQDAKQTSHDVQESLACLTEMILTINPDAIKDFPEIIGHKKRIKELTLRSRKRCSETVTASPIMDINGEPLYDYDDMRESESTNTTAVGTQGGASCSN